MKNKIKTSKMQSIFKNINRIIAMHQKIVPAITAFVLFIILYAIGGMMFGDVGFLTLRTFFSLFTDNIHVMVVAIGMTLVIISGGIDLSVGSVAALSTMIIAYGTAVDHGVDQIGMGWPIGFSISLALFIGTFLGFIMGVMIQVFKVQPFIATLSGMFFARGMCFIISVDSIPITDPLFTALGSWRLQFRDVLNANPNLMVNFPIGIFIFLALFIAVIILMRWTKLGRNIYALGGNEQSAQLMGLPIKSTRVFVYSFSGFCAALAGVVSALQTHSGFGRHMIGMELDAIAAAVIGGALMSGGIGFPVGAVLGILVIGVIQKFVTFGGLGSGYARIATGLLLFLFIALQRIIMQIADRNKVI